jgi:hypothetical protein
MVRRPGHRGAFLFFLAILDLVYAWGLHLTATPQRAAADLYLPWSTWEVSWMLTGIFCAAGAFLRRDRGSFVLAAMLDFSWGGVSLANWLGGSLPNGWLSAVVWMAFSATVLIISSWPDPKTRELEYPLPERFREEGT